MLAIDNFILLDASGTSRIIQHGQKDAISASFKYAGYAFQNKISSSIDLSKCEIVS